MEKYQLRFGIEWGGTCPADDFNERAIAIYRRLIGELGDEFEVLFELTVPYGMPWFENYGTPEGIIDFISTGKFIEYGFVAFNSFHQKKNLGFSLLYSGRFDEGIGCINDLMSEIKAVDFMLTYKKRLAEFVESAKNRPDKIPEILTAAIIENKKGLKI
jgi:hypothetical protein